MKEIRPVAKSEIKEALANNAWDLGNQVLYNLCSKHPFHKTDQEVIAKIWLIGRSYAAAIERHKIKGLKLTGDNFYAKRVAPKIKRRKIDKWFAQLKKEPTPENIIEIHSKLTQLFYEISKLEKRSLASKYLHFHRRHLFFMFDSRSITAIRKVTPSGEKQLPNISPAEFDSDYLKFYRRCLWLQQDLKRRFGRKFTPREIDKILLHIEEKL